MFSKTLIKLAVLMSGLSVMITPALALAPTNGWCENGGQVVITGSNSSTTKVQRSYPPCNVTVFVTGTGGIKATIYADAAGNALSNPFTSGTNGFWQFYAANGRYDVQLSGGGLPIPTSVSDVLLFDPVGAKYVTTDTVQTITATKNWNAPQVMNSGTSGQVTLGPTVWAPLNDGIVDLGTDATHGFNHLFLSGPARFNSNIDSRGSANNFYGSTFFRTASLFQLLSGSTFTIDSGTTFTINSGGTGAVAMGTTQWAPSTDASVDLGFSTARGFNRLFLSGPAEFKGNINVRGTANNFYSGSLNVFRGGSTLQTLTGSAVTMDTGTTFLLNSGGTGEVTMGNSQWAPTTDAIVDLGFSTARGFNRLFLSGAAEFKGNINIRGSSNQVYGGMFYRNGSTVDFLNGSVVTFQNGTSIVPPVGSVLDGTTTCMMGEHINTITISQGLVTGVTCN